MRPALNAIDRGTFGSRRTMPGAGAAWLVSILPPRRELASTSDWLWRPREGTPTLLQRYASAISIYHNNVTSCNLLFQSRTKRVSGNPSGEEFWLVASKTKTPNCHLSSWTHVSILLALAKPHDGSGCFHRNGCILFALPFWQRWSWLEHCPTRCSSSSTSISSTEIIGLCNQYSQIPEHFLLGRGNKCQLANKYFRLLTIF